MMMILWILNIFMERYNLLIEFCPWDRRDVTIERYLFPWLAIISISAMGYPSGWCNIAMFHAPGWMHCKTIYVLAFSTLIWIDSTSWTWTVTCWAFGLGLVLLTRLHILLVIEVWAWYRDEHRHRVRDWLSRSSRIWFGWKVTIRGVWNGLAECTDIYWWEAEDQELSCCVWKHFPAPFSRAAWLATGSRIENMSLIKFCVESPSARSAVKLVKCKSTTLSG